MALTRKFLSAMGIEEDKIDQIIDAHVETVNALKTERDQYKSSAEKYPGVVAELEKANKTIETFQSDGFEKKYNEISEQFEAYKKEVESKELNNVKEKAYVELLKTVGVSEKRIPAIMKLTSLSEIELTKDNKLKSIDKLTETIKNEWADFIESEGQAGSQTPNPPGNNVNGGMTKEEFNKLSLSERMDYANAHPNETAKLLD